MYIYFVSDFVTSSDSTFGNIPSLEFKEYYMSSFRLYTKTVMVLLLALSFWACEKEISTSPVEVQNKYNGKIFIDSYPADADLYVEGKISGLKTPDTLCWLENRAYRITLKKYLHIDTTLVIGANSSVPEKVFVDYYKNPKMLGALKCTTFPESSDVYLNDEYVSLTTPFIMDSLIPGNYKVRYTKTGFRDWEGSFLIKSSTTNGTTIPLEDTTIWVSYTEQNSGLLEDIINDIAVDSNNTIWFACSERGLASFDGVTWNNWNTGNSGLHDDGLTEIEIDNCGGRWLGITSGISYFNNGEWGYYSGLDMSLNNDYISGLKIDNNGNVWAASFGGMMLVTPDKVLETYTNTNSGLGTNMFNSVCTDIAGEVWAGAVRGGLWVFNGTDWNKIDMDISLGDNISAIAKEYDTGNIWIGVWPTNSRPGGLISFIDGEWEVEYNQLVSREITSIYIDKSDRKFIGTTKGLIVFRDYSNKVTFTSENSNLKSSSIRAIESDKFGNIWIATISGVTKLKIAKIDLP